MKKKLHPKFKKGALGATLAVVTLAVLRLFDIEVDETTASLITAACTQIGVYVGGEQSED